MTFYTDRFEKDKRTGPSGETPDIEVIDLKVNKCDHYFLVDGDDVKCRDCFNGWPGFARHVRVEDGKIIAS